MSATALQDANAAGRERSPALPGAPARDGVQRAPSDRALRIAYLTTAYPEVSHTFIRREILELERRGHRVTRLSVRRPSSELVDPLDRAESERTTYLLDRPAQLVRDTLAMMLGSPLALLRAASAALTLSRRSDRSLLRHLAYLLEACAVVRILARTGAEHLHVHFGTNAAAVALLAREIAGTRYSVAFHGPDEFDAPIGLSLGAKIEDSVFCTAISEFAAAQLRRWVEPAQWNKIRIIRCSVDAHFGLEAAPIPRDSKRLVCVGRLCTNKGHLVLLEAAARLARDGLDFELVLAGDGELRAEVERAIGAWGLAGKVIVTGWVSGAAVRDRLRESRAFVSASLAEGLPVVMMEAFALGRPVIGTFIAGVPELVEPGASGWLVPAGSAPALAAAMREALELPVGRLAEMGARGRARVLSQHATESEVARLEALFREFAAAP
jgi:glycosyltransferase involved in cell wall biosynthesis